MIKQIIEKWKLIIETQLSKKKQEDTRLPYIHYLLQIVQKIVMFT